jgi:uncharacterized protein
LMLDLELESDLRKLEDPEVFLRFHQDKLIVIDEIQRLPRLFPLLRALVDEQRRPGRFLILGSASPNVLRESSESLAGRIAYTELTPFNLTEIEHHEIGINQHWLRGGFPEPLMQTNDQIVWRWIDNFINTFLERDLRLLGYEIAPEAMRRVLLMLTGYHANLLNISELSRSLGISAPTVSKYLDVLEGSFLIRRLMPEHVNISKRIVKSPKFYFRDSGIFHALAGIASMDQLIGHRVSGASWEGYAIEQIIQCKPERWRHSFYRTQAGAEADLVLCSPAGNFYLIEIKTASTAKLSVGFFNSFEDLQAKAGFIIVREPEYYPKRDGVMVIGLSRFLNEVLAGLE